MERIEDRFNIDPAEVRAVAVGVALFQPVKRFFFVTDGEIDKRMVVSQSLPVWMHFVELGEGLLRDIFVPHFSFRHSEKGQMQRVAAQLSGLFELCDRARQITFRLQDHAQNLARIKKARIELDRFLRLCHRFVVTAGVVQRISTIRVDDGRQRIQFDRPFGLCDGFVKSAKTVERTVAIPLMRRGVVWLKFDCSLEFPFSSGEIQIIKIQDFAQGIMRLGEVWDRFEALSEPPLALLPWHRVEARKNTMEAGRSY